MTNTTNNVPRELKPVLAMILNALDRDAADGKQARAEMAAELRAILSAPSPADHVEDVRAMVAAQSPAGVDGLRVIGWYTEDHLDDKSATTYSREVADRWLAKGWPITGIANAAAAQAIIDGLRGEVAELVKHSEVVAQWHADAMFAIRDLKDANAVRINELERILTRAQIWIVDETGPGWELSEAIEAALTASKDSEQ